MRQYEIRFTLYDGQPERLDRITAMYNAHREAKVTEAQLLEMALSAGSMQLIDGRLDMLEDMVRQLERLDDQREDREGRSA